ncbi:MAG: hypothetical protein DI528_20905 [Shinella sp.]|nr:MAG: hypothetical protein DI528_20905 [Shinella sp.]
MNMTQPNSQVDEILQNLTEAPPISADLLEGTFWRFFNLNGQVLTSFMVLAPQGLIGNFISPSIDFWQVVNGRLCLVADNGLPSVVFNVARVTGGKIVTLAGRGLVDGREAIYILQSVEHPAHPMFATPASQDRKARFLVEPQTGARRPNLVVVPAGAKSLHPHWLEGVTGLTRNWDLCIGYYGTEQPEIATPHEYLAHIPNTKKFRLLYNLFYEGSPLWQYDAIWLPDDDLLCTGQDINRMFHLFHKFGLDLAQPSLKDGPDSHPNHPLTIQRAGGDVRYEAFVEIMCPIFSRRGLEICIGSMRDVDSGYGLDHLWPALLGYPRSRIGIIDAAAVVHTRPIGATYDIRGAILEQAEVHRVYGHTMRQISGVK